MEREYENVKVIQSGTNYITIRIPKKSFESLPEGYFYCDIELKNIRGGKNK